MSRQPCGEDKHSSRNPLCSTTREGNTSKQIRPPTVGLTCTGGGCLNEMPLRMTQRSRCSADVASARLARRQVGA